MSERLHNMDDIFKSAYRQFEEEPTADVWQKINAVLDKKDTESYKKRSLKWKRVSLLLLLLLAGFILYETLMNRVGTNSQKNSVAGNKTELKNRKESTSELRNTMNDQRKIIYVESGQVANKRSFTEKLSQTDASINNDYKTSAIFVTQKNTLISFMEELKTNYPDTAFFKKVLSPSPLFIDNSASLKNNSTNKIQPGKKDPGISWTYTPFVSYEWAQYRIDSDLPVANTIKDGEAHEPSFSAGVLLTAPVTEAWMLQSGIIYSNTAIAIAPQKVYAVQVPGGDYAYKYVTSSGYGYIRPGFGTAPVIGDSLATAEAKHLLNHISVPVVIKYKTGRGKFTFLPGAGIAGDFLINTKVETEITNAANKETVIITKLAGAKKFNLSIIADAEMRYEVTKKMFVTLRPSFRYAISSITKNDDFETFPYALGLGLGMTFKF